MPIYEYVCEKCGCQFELLKSKMTTNSCEKCPDCGGRSSQQLSVFGVGAGSAGEMPCGSDTCPTGAGSCAGGSCPLSQG